MIFDFEIKILAFFDDFYKVNESEVKKYSFDPSPKTPLQKFTQLFESVVK